VAQLQEMAASAAGRLFADRLQAFEAKLGRMQVRMQQGVVTGRLLLFDWARWPKTAAVTFCITSITSITHCP